jgi:hypothetical protein
LLFQQDCFAAFFGVRKLARKQAAALQILVAAAGHAVECVAFLFSEQRRRFACPG